MSQNRRVKPPDDISDGGGGCKAYGTPHFEVHSIVGENVAAADFAGMVEANGNGLT